MCHNRDGFSTYGMAFTSSLLMGNMTSCRFSRTSIFRVKPFDGVVRNLVVRQTLSPSNGPRG